MDMNEYQRASAETAVYPVSKGLEYTALGLAGEAGEYANKVKKVLRDGSAAYDLEAFADELGDVLWYVAMAAHENDFTLNNIAKRNLNKLEHRRLAGTLGGSGDNR